MPPLEDQLNTLGLFFDQSSVLNGIIERTQREIDLIREYRTRLIADVVTGKVDVRGAAASLPVALGGEDALEEEDVWVEEQEAGEDDGSTPDEGGDDV